MFDLIVLGAGASGLTAAITAKRRNPKLKVLIIEKTNKPGQKILATGAGKCNLTNVSLDLAKYSNPRFIQDSIPDFNYKEVMDFFASLGLKFYVNNEGLVYPYSERATTVQYVLLNEIEKLGIKICLDTIVEKVIKDNTGFTLTTKKGEVFSTKYLVFATGGVTYKNLGSDGSSYSLLEGFHIKFTKQVPGNVYLYVEENIKKLSGIRMKVSVKLYNDDKLVVEEAGEILFKDKAISGIVIFNLSTYLARLFVKNEVKNPFLAIDFLPQMSTDELTSEVMKQNNLRKYLLGIFYDKLVDCLLYSNDKNKLIHNLKDYRFKVNSLGDSDNAQITVGGIKLNEVTTNFMAKDVDNLYFVGEVLDIDAPCGGYNLTFAFLSGKRVGDIIGGK